MSEQYLEIRRIYVKNLTLETTNTPQVFKETETKDWDPKVKVDLKVEHSELEENIFDVTLLIDISAQPKPDTKLFHIKAEESGVFHIEGYNEKDTEYLLATYCPEMLFPYAHEIVANLVTHATFPQLNLLPVNFKALYEHQQKAGTG